MKKKVWIFLLIIICIISIVIILKTILVSTNSTKKNCTKYKPLIDSVFQDYGYELPQESDKGYLMGGYSEEYKILLDNNASLSVSFSNYKKSEKIIVECSGDSLVQINENINFLIDIYNEVSLINVNKNKVKKIVQEQIKSNSTDVLEEKYLSLLFDKLTIIGDNDDYVCHIEGFTKKGMFGI